MSKEYRTFTQAELELAEKLSYERWYHDIEDIGFEFNGMWIITPFMEDTGRFSFKDFDSMCEYYGKDNVIEHISRVLDAVIRVEKVKWDSIDSDYKGTWMDYHNECPDWIGRKVVMSGCVTQNPAELGKLLVEGVHFIIEE